MQLEHAGILDLGRLKYVIKLVFKLKFAQGFLYENQIVWSTHVVRPVSFVDKILLTVLLPDRREVSKPIEYFLSMHIEYFFLDGMNHIHLAETTPKLWTNLIFSR